MSKWNPRNWDRRNFVAKSSASARGIEPLESRTMFNATPTALLVGGNPAIFSQDWTNANLIQNPNDWSGVPSIQGFRGDSPIGTGVDPQTIATDLTDATQPVASLNQVVANADSAVLFPNSNASGGVYEFDSTVNPTLNPTIALNGSGTADSPFIVLYIDSTGVPNVTVQYLLRDLETTDNTNQQYALQYRTATSGTWTNVPSGYVADATDSGNTKTTPVSANLPGDAGNQANLQIRIITTNAPSSDEFVGIDDIVVKATPAVEPPGQLSIVATAARERECRQRQHQGVAHRRHWRRGHRHGQHR